MSSIGVWRICTEIATSQKGLITRAQALACGLSARTIDRLVADGLLVAVHPGVYRLAGSPEAPLQSLWGGWLWFGPGSFISHRSAGADIWTLEGVPSGPPELSGYTAKRRSGLRLHRLQPDDRPSLRFREGLPFTCVERTLLDLCGVMRAKGSGLATDDALRRRLTTLDRLHHTLELSGGRGRKGAAQMATLLEVRDDRDGRLASKMEARMLRILKGIGDPDFVPQHPVHDGTRNYRIDFAYPKEMLGIECHSIKWHFGVQQLQRDSARDRRLKALGWIILYFTYDEIFLTPELVAQEIREAKLRTIPSHRHPLALE